MSEQKRGCGYRKIGGLYLVSDPGFQLECDGLPLGLEPCECCGFKPPFSRNLQRIHPAYISQGEKQKHELEHEGLGVCSCPITCPLCQPKSNGIYGLMFVGSKYYTPESFVKEAFSHGVSKRIPEIPSWLILGETWVFLAHQQVAKEEPGLHSKLYPDLKFGKLRKHEPTEFIQAIFHGFRPQRIEMPVWKGDLSETEIQKLEQKGITPVLLDRSPENLKRHKNARNLELNLKKFLKVRLKAESEEEGE